MGFKLVEVVKVGSKVDPAVRERVEFAKAVEKWAGRVAKRRAAKRSRKGGR